MLKIDIIKNPLIIFWDGTKTKMSKSTICTEKYS